MKSNVLTLFASLPLVGYLIILTFALVTKLHIGHWPYYSNPDPKELEMPFWLTLSSIGFFASIVGAIAVPVIFAVATLSGWRRTNRAHRGPLVAALSLYALGMALWIGDLAIGAFSHWILD